MLRISALFLLLVSILSSASVSASVVDLGAGQSITVNPGSEAMTVSCASGPASAGSKKPICKILRVYNDAYEIFVDGRMVFSVQRAFRSAAAFAEMNVALLQLQQQGACQGAYYLAKFEKL